MDVARAEHIVRALSTMSRNDIAAIDHALETCEIRHAALPGAISMKLDTGKSWREARVEGIDVATTIATKGSGIVAFRGVIGASDWKTQDGSTLGNASIGGSE